MFKNQDCEHIVDLKKSYEKCNALINCKFIGSQKIHTHINFSKKLLYNMLLYENFLIFNVLFSESRISGREAAKEIDQLAAIQW
jgi:hypothetical protein